MATVIRAIVVHRDGTERAGLRAALEALPGVEIAGERTDLRSGIRQDDPPDAIRRVQRNPERRHSTDRNAA